MTWTWWMTLLVILAVLALIGCIPVGVDARYGADGIFLAAKLGPFRLQLLPQNDGIDGFYICKLMKKQ